MYDLNTTLNIAEFILIAGIFIIELADFLYDWYWIDRHLPKPKSSNTLVNTLQG
jgi:hypothetical protein